MKNTELEIILVGTFFLIALPLITAQSLRESHKEEPPFYPTSIVHALIKAYPDALSKAVFKNGDWHLTVRGDNFLWSQGRLLPEDQILMDREYDAYPFYSYPSDYNPPLWEYTQKQEEEMIQLIKGREENPVNRHPGFLKALYRIQDEESAWKIMKTTYFLGHKVMIHRDLLEDLAHIEEKIQIAMVQDTPLREYVDSIEVLEGFHWRTIEGTDTLSNHSFGIAIDIIPRDYQAREAYWRWSQIFFPKWYNLPWEKRHLPPESFIRAFENEGFIWGGKWLFFDNIHFEYRPEILILNEIG